MTAEQAVEYLRNNVDALIRVAHPCHPQQWARARVYYAGLPADDAADLSWYWIESVQAWAEQFPEVGAGQIKRRAVTAALAEVMDAEGPDPDAERDRRKCDQPTNVR